MTMKDTFVRLVELVATDFANISIALFVIFSATVAALATIHTYYYYKIKISKRTIINHLRKNIKGTEEIKKFLLAHSQSAEFSTDNDLKSVLIEIASLEKMFKDFEASVTNEEFDKLYKQMEDIRLVIEKIWTQVKNSK